MDTEIVKQNILLIYLMKKELRMMMLNMLTSNYQVAHCGQKIIRQTTTIPEYICLIAKLIA